MAEKLNTDDYQLNCIKGVNESYKNQLSDIGSKLRTQTYVFRNKMNDSNSTKEEKLASFDDVATTKGQLRRTRMEMALVLK